MSQWYRPICFFFSSRRRHTRCSRDWSSDVCSSDLGLAGGATINVQIKSGTNEVHGSAFEYHSNQHLKAWPESVPPGQSQKPMLVYNQFGGTIGGPIKKDKLFYFVSYEGRSHNRNVSRKVDVPTD